MKTTNEEYVIICHNGTFNGDCALSAFVPIIISSPDLSTVVSQMTSEKLCELYKDAYLKQNDRLDESDWIDWGEEELTHLKGVWILTKEVFDKLTNASLNVECYRDAHVYMLQSMMKHLFNSFCIAKVDEILSENK